MVIARSMWVLVVAVILLVLGHRIPFYIVGGIGVVTMLLGFVLPRVWLKLSALGDHFAAWVGRLLGWVLLTPVFYLVIVPAGLVLRVTGRDPLHRRFRAEGVSYWIRRSVKPEAAQYARQFLVEDRRARAEIRPIATDDFPDDSGVRSSS